MFVYADHAATTEMSPAAREAMARGVAEYWANPSSLHTAGQKVREVLEDARARIAAGLNGSTVSARLRSACFNALRATSLMGSSAFFSRW